MNHSTTNDCNGNGNNGNGKNSKATLLPKKETGGLDFLAKNPNSDGRGIIIAIFDSGVDPGANGLQKTTQGLPKLIERYDCSGAGDVDTSKIVEIDAGGYIIGLGGRKLKIPQTWNNPCRKFHIGIKPVYELYPEEVKKRVEIARKAEWDEEAGAIIAALYAKQQENGKNNNNNNVEEDLIQKLANYDLEAQLELITGLEKHYKDFDLGPLLDCLVWREDGDEWKVCLCQNGNLEEGILLREYKRFQEFAALNRIDQMNVSVNIHDEGNTLEIVGICSPHGTHVASIAAGYFPEDPNSNGVAPGAQLISLMISDSRLETMETGTAMIRAMAFVMQNSERIHIINMSYGESAHWRAIGRVGNLMKEVVDRFGIVWVCSAGNDGPALSTINTPPWVKANTLIGVGAYLSPEMMTLQHSMRERLPAMVYPWSSRGPTLDGELGISVIAPGGAITSVPNYTLRNVEQMSGTSMASPNTAGCIALILSKAKAEGVPWSPYSVKKALELSAKMIEGIDYLTQGFGLVQVVETYITLERLSKTPKLWMNVRFDITVTSNKGEGSNLIMKGIYIRDPSFDKPKEYTISVEPVFFKQDIIDPRILTEFQQHFEIVSTVPWIQVPQTLVLWNHEIDFRVIVNPEGLLKGLNFGMIQFFEPNTGQQNGSVFNVFVTVIKAEPFEVISPLSRPNLIFPNISYQAGQINRHFVKVPKGISWATLSLKMLGTDCNTNPNATSRFIIQTLTVNVGRSFKSNEFRKYYTLTTLEGIIIPLKVTEGRIMELVIVRSNEETSKVVFLSSSLTFHGLCLTTEDISISAGDAFKKLTIQNSFETEILQISAVLENQITMLRPIESKIVQLKGPRDSIPPGGSLIYQLENTYNFQLLQNTEIMVNCVLLSETLYECEFESQLWQLFDEHKRYLGAGSGTPSRGILKVKKGEYTLRLHVRHENRDLLEKLMLGKIEGRRSSHLSPWIRDIQIPFLPILLSMKLDSIISLNVFPNQSDLQELREPNYWSVTLKRESKYHAFLSTYIKDADLKDLPSPSTLYLEGTIRIHKDEPGKRLVSYPFKLTLPIPPPPPPPPPPPMPITSNVMMTVEDLRDSNIKYLCKLNPIASRNLYDSLKGKFNLHIPLHVERLEALDKEIPKTISICREIITLGDFILNLNVNQRNEEDISIKVLTKKGLALAELLKNRIPPVTIESLDRILRRLLEFVEIFDPKIMEFVYEHAIARGHFGRALQVLHYHIERDSVGWTAEIDRKIIQAFKSLGWNKCSLLWEGIMHLRYPQKFRPF